MRLVIVAATPPPHYPLDIRRAALVFRPGVGEQLARVFGAQFGAQ